MSQFNVQDAIESLREDMNDQFSTINTKLDDHISTHIDIESRLATVEDRQTLLGRGVWGLFIAAFGSLTAYIFGHK